MNKNELVDEILKRGMFTKESISKHTEEYLTLYLEQIKINGEIMKIEQENREMEDKLTKNRRSLNALYRNIGTCIEKFKFIDN